MLVTTGRVLAAHWPALLAWYLAGILGRYAAIQVAGFVGAYTAIGGMLLLPLAILARLTGYVAMLLVVRDGMTRLGVLAPLPADRRARRRAFADALLGGILPFFAFYAAWEFLREDVAAYTARGLEVRQGIVADAALAGETASSAGTLDDLGLGPVTIALIVVAYAGRWAWNRYRERLPKALAVGAVYLEAVWVFLTVIVIAQLIGSVNGWVATRQAMVWLADARAWVADRLVPVAWVWEGVLWLLGEAGGIILLPVAWLTIAGVIYGQAVAAQAPRLSGAAVERARTRYGRIAAPVRRRLNEFAAGLVARFQPIWSALVLMWRAGPVLVGGYVLLYTGVLAVESLLRIGVTRLVGPQELFSFWTVFWPVILLAVPVVVEPLRIALVAGAYDAALDRLVPHAPTADGRVEAAGSAVDGEPHEPGGLVGDGDVDVQAAGGVAGDEERDDEGVGPGLVRDA